MGIQKNFQAVSPLKKFCIWEREESKEFSDCVLLNSLTREKRDTKEFRRLVLGEFFLAKVEGNEEDE